MPAVEQHQPTDRPAAPQQTAPGFHSTLNETWGPGAVKPPEQQPSNALDGFNQFCIGFGAGLGNFAVETTKAASQAITHPGETIHNAADGTGKALHAAGEASVAGSSYLANKVSHGDVAGMTNDAVHTGQAIGNGMAQSVDHFNHLSAKEKGYIVGHDVAPTVIGTIIAPELIPEGAVAAGLGKVASVVGTVIKEESVVAKVASTFEGAREKMATISEKLAAMTEKMDALIGPKGSAIVRDGVKCVEEGEKKGFEHLKPVRVVASPVSDGFAAEVEHAQTKLEGFIVDQLQKEDVKTYVVEKISHVFGDDYDRIPACFNPNDKLAPKGIYIAEKVWNQGQWKNNTDVLFRINHEVGHLFDETLKTDWLSNTAEFAKAFAKDWKEISESEPNFLILGAKPDHLRRNEVFADLFAHLRGESTSTYSIDMRRLFPNTMKHMIAKDQKW